MEKKGMGEREEEKMPQLDTATYRGQVTWLVLVFVTYYRIVRGELFPALTRVVKVRAKKKSHSVAMSQSHQSEAKTVMQGYDRAVGKAALSALALIQTELDNQSSWSASALESVLTGGERGPVNGEYLEAVAEVESEAVTCLEDLEDRTSEMEDDLDSADLA